MHEPKTNQTPNQFDLPLPTGAPVRKSRANAEAFIRVLNTASMTASSANRITRTDLIDFFVDLTKGDELDYKIALWVAMKRAIEGGSTHIREVQDHETRETCYEGVDLSLLKELFPTGTTLVPSESDQAVCQSTN